MQYNDRSPLENMHCAKLFEIVNHPDTAIFSILTRSQYVEVRKVCIEVILHTDMAKHFSMVKEVQMLFEVHSEQYAVRNPDTFPGPDLAALFRQPEQKKLFANLFLHVADVANPLRPFKLCRLWAARVLEEFFLQGDQEKELGVPVQMLNDRAKVNRPFSQIGFIEFLVSPLAFAAARVLPPLDGAVEQMLQNITMWQKEWVAESAPKEEEVQGVTARIAVLRKKLQDIQDDRPQEKCS